MCGSEIEEETVNKERADIELLSNINPKRHFCENGNFGVADFIGFKKED